MTKALIMAATLVLMVMDVWLYSRFDWAGPARATTALIVTFVAVSVVNRVRMTRKLRAIMEAVGTRAVAAPFQPPPVPGEPVLDEHAERKVAMLVEAFMAGRLESLDNVEGAGESAYEAAIVYGTDNGWTSSAREEIARHVQRTVIWQLTMKRCG